MRGSGPVPSADGKALLLIVPLTPEQTAEDAIAGVLDLVRAEVDSGRPSGLEARLTGGPAASADIDGAFDALDERLLIVTVAVVALLLPLTYRSPILLLLPLIAAGAASQLANAVIYLCAKHFGLVVDGVNAGILTVLVFGAAGASDLDGDGAGVGGPHLWCVGDDDEPGARGHVRGEAPCACSSRSSRWWWSWCRRRRSRCSP